MPAVDELIAILGYKIEGKGKLNEFTRGLDGVENKAKRSAGVMGALGRTMVGALAGAATVGAVKSAVTNFAEFERQMTRIGVTAGASAAATTKASEDVQRLAKDFALPIDQAVRGLDTLVASGQSLEQAMTFLPSVLATAQAAGAATDDIANTALKAADSLKIQTKDLQRAFDIMVAGGKAGQFELRDMAQYIPSLANSFASIGYKGEAGLQKLIALMQTVRQDTGDASSAATQLQNIFLKYNSEEVAKNFKDLGIKDFTQQLDNARKAGRDVLDVFLELTNQAIKGDMSKLGRLFSDQEFRLGVQSLLTSRDAYKEFIDAVNGSKVEGTVMQDLNRVLSDTQAKIDQISNSWDRFLKSLGAAVSAPVSGFLDTVSNALNFDEALRKGAAASGMSLGELFIQQPFMSRDELDALARKGGFVPIKGVSGEGLFSAADSRKSPSQLAREKLEAERDALRAEIKALEETPVRRGTFGAQERRAARQGHFQREMDRINSGINATYPVDPDRFKSFPSTKPSAAAPDYSAQLQAVAAKVEGMNANLAKMTGTAPVNATVTDARQDNRQFPVTVNAPISMTVTQPTQAPAALANAAAGAVKAGVEAQPARMQSGPQP
jgi:TP901 family phage tail tape measure protein